MSEQMSINSKDLAELYLKNSSVEILAGLMKKNKIYVITKDLEEQYQSYSKLERKLEEELSQLPGNYLARWITQDYLLDSQPFSERNLKRRGSLFEVGAEQLFLQSLYSRTTYFIFLQIEVAYSMTKSLNKINSCLYLPSEKYEQAINNM